MVQMRGFLDAANERRIAGWIVDPAQREPLFVDIYFNDQLMRRLRADKYRKDLTPGIHPTGECSFELVLAEETFRLLPPEVVVRVVEAKTGRELEGSPKTFAGNPSGRAGPIVNPRGEKLSINKNGGFSVKFSDRFDGWRDTAVESALGIINALAENGHTAMIAYGSMLGAVREGRLIDHDDDVDLMIISSAATQSEAGDDFVAVLKYLSSRGFGIDPVSRGQAHIYSQVNGEPVGTDLFVAWFDRDDRFYLNFAIDGRLTRGDVLPPRMVPLESHDVPIPADAEAVCRAIYGDDWAYPDPFFVWKFQKSTREFFSTLNRSISENKVYWDTFYSGAPRLDRPSQFSAFVAGELEGGETIVDVGCGTGKDSLLFSRLGMRVFGLDFSNSAIATSRKAAESVAKDRAVFLKFNIHDRAAFDGVRRKVRDDARQVAIYSRFFLHAISEDGEDSFVEFCRTLAGPGERAYMEFRTLEDAAGLKATGNHYRRYVDPHHLSSKFHRAGFDPVYFVSGRGFAKYKTDDAFVARLIVERRR